MPAIFIYVTGQRGQDEAATPLPASKTKQCRCFLLHPTARFYDQTFGSSLIWHSTSAVLIHLDSLLHRRNTIDMIASSHQHQMRRAALHLSASENSSVCFDKALQSETRRDHSRRSRRRREGHLAASAVYTSISCLLVSDNLDAADGKVFISNFW